MDYVKSKKRVLFIGAFFLFVLMFGLYFILQSRSFDKTSEIEVNDPTALELFVLDEFKDNDDVDYMVYGFSSLLSDDIIVQYYSDMDDTSMVTPNDLESYDGMVEFNETQYVYEFANGQSANKKPRVDFFTKRVPIFDFETSNLSDAYYNVFYTNQGDFELDTDYFVGDIEYMIVYLKNPESDGYHMVRYVQPSTYPDVQSIIYSNSDDYISEIESITVDDSTYLRYDMESIDSTIDE